jgi:hypothetical protein
MGDERNLKRVREKTYGFLGFKELGFLGSFRERTGTGIWRRKEVK